MAIPTAVVTAARKGWHWQWNQLMNGLAPCDESGSYSRPATQKQNARVPLKEDLINREFDHLPRLIIGRSCPWAHRTWLVFKLRKLEKTITLVFAKADHDEGRWKLEKPLMGCNSLTALYKKCGTPPSFRATVPVLIDPRNNENVNPEIMGNESAQLIEVLNNWPTQTDSPNLAPKELIKDINKWQMIIQPFINNGVYKCGFARNQKAYNKASKELFEALEKVEKNLTDKGPWLCGEKITLADIKLFPTLIRWEAIYEPLFGCSQKPIWLFPNICNWRRKIYEIPQIAETCNEDIWRKDYFGALFPLRPSNIVPSGPSLTTFLNHNSYSMDN
mgnify:CR=1 FL=1|tara:strand:- start:91858 stop:92853 length:996 start_codon:yes stop_codon:yes gene_type:complete